MLYTVEEIGWLLYWDSYTIDKYMWTSLGLTLNSRVEGFVKIQRCPAHRESASGLETWTRPVIYLQLLTFLYWNTYTKFKHFISGFYFDM